MGRARASRASEQNSRTGAQAHRSQNPGQRQATRGKNGSRADATLLANNRRLGSLYAPGKRVRWFFLSLVFRHHPLETLIRQTAGGTICCLSAFPESTGISSQ